MTKSYLYLGKHAGTLASCGALSPGDIVQLDEKAEKEPHNQTLIKSGQLVFYPTKPDTEPVQVEVTAETVETEKEPSRSKAPQKRTETQTKKKESENR